MLLATMMQPTENLSSLAENNGEETPTYIEAPSQKKWVAPKYYENCARLSMYIHKDVHRKLRIEAIQRNISKRQLVELAICKELNIEPPPLQIRQHSSRHPRDTPPEPLAA